MTLTEEKKRERIARRIALELRDGYYVNLGIGMPTLVANYVPQGIDVNLQTENSEKMHASSHRRRSRRSHRHRTRPHRRHARRTPPPRTRSRCHAPPRSVPYRAKLIGPTLRPQAHAHLNDRMLLLFWSGTTG